MNVTIFYDDAFQNLFPNNTEEKIYDLMDIVRTMYSNFKKHSSASIEIELIGTKQMKGKNWGWKNEIKMAKSQ